MKKKFSILKRPSAITMIAMLAVAATLALAAPWLAPPAPAAVEGQAPGRAMAHQAVDNRAEEWTTTDHSKHAALKATFRDGQQITAACLSCHSEAGEQLQTAIHWTWIDPQSDPDSPRGKAGYSLNNFCISANGMEDKSCNACHIGWNGKGSGKTSEINCLTCHGQKKFNFEEAFADLAYFLEEGDEDSAEFAREAAETISLAAQSVGRPTRRNCGGCHFTGGGGDGVKHGDLDTSLLSPGKSLDVHMSQEGQNFQCTRCHTTHQHQVAGRVYTTPAARDRKSLLENDLNPRIMCESCHSDRPHKSDAKANDHTDRVACQSCHIPTMARGGNPTKMWWDWSKAGRTRDGEPYVEEDPELQRHNYMSIKGEMKWAVDVAPEYFWYNGSVRSLKANDTIRTDSPQVELSRPMGDPSDPDARIYPFKVHRGKQPYDTVHKTLLPPMLSGPEGYWATLDWQVALKAGTEALNLPYSGEYDFVQTSYVYPTTHMVAPKGDAVSCGQCHTRENGRMAGVAGVYIPGRDRFRWLDIAGWLAVIGAALGVGVHGIGRFIFRKNGKKD